MSRSQDSEKKRVASAKIDASYEEAWNRIREVLKNELGEATYRSWLSPLALHSVTADAVTLSVPTRFMREWVQSHYSEMLQKQWKKEYAELSQCHVIVDRSSLQSAEPDRPQVKEERALSAAIPDDELAHISSPLDPRFTFENFVVGKPNELAFAAAKRIAEGGQVLTGCNPLFIHGGVGLGKTHLMHSIAWRLNQQSPERRVMYLSAEKFMYQFIRALRNKESFAFKELFRSVDVLMIDDIQFIAGKESTQEEFFHTFNSLVDQNKQLVISGDRAPVEMEGIEERIRSRLGWGLVADIGATTYELRLGILQSKLMQMKNVQVPNKVIEFLAHKITSNVRELEGALNRVVAHSTLVGRAITLETTQEVLADLLRANDKRLTIEEIQKKVTQHYNIKMSDMFSARRSRVVARPRQIAMYLSKKLTPRSLPEIGRKFGGRDHTTVMHAVRRIEELCQSDSAIQDDVQALIQLLRN
jgi:chromosomal replication initiator protein